MGNSEKNYPEIAKQARLTVLDMIYRAQTSHIGSNFSVIDIMTVLFENVDLNKDKVILSAGWKAASLYYFLHRKGRIPKEAIDMYCQPGSKWIGLAEPIHPDIPFAGGSMGYGLPAAVGFALAKKLKNEPGMVYCIMSDGEMDIGTTWEAALIAVHYKLNNIRIIVDKNNFQAMGKVDDILSLNFPGKLEEKWGSFGFATLKLDGHCHEDMDDSLFQETRAPSIVLCETIKGKGVSFMENNNDFHYLHVTDEQYEKAKAELNGQS